MLTCGKYRCRTIRYWHIVSEYFSYPSSWIRKIPVSAYSKFTEVAMKKRAPRAVSEIKKYATKAMATKDVRINTKLNKSRAPRSVAGPSIRQQLERSYKNYLQTKKSPSM